MEEIVIFLSFLVLTSAISGGHDTSITRYKWQLSLREEGIHFCGATLIDQEWGLTSAYCVDQRRPQGLSIRAGSANLVSQSLTDGFEVAVDYYIIYPRYNRLTHDSDLALLHFARNITEDIVLTVSLPFCITCDVSSTSPTTMTGWGTLKPGEAFSKVLQMGYVSTISRDNCQFTYPGKVITLNMFCAGYLRSQSLNINACDGDFGGPAMVFNRLEGIISWGTGCGTSRFPTVMTRVAPFMHWIQQQTGLKFGLI
ncbi:unnamed protein product [Psylliodes chrysocephalus]|uniref:Peptidase S1 domain-containing protein n=1 Tax=Psylliodes chrysocephalus TaxID=3402493 RepID=A0A9P0GDT4_9CUCU|nr:unnamed protein product [Psylliodes chrysocephala]